jgi:hypothetical protein
LIYSKYSNAVNVVDLTAQIPLLTALCLAPKRIAFQIGLNQWQSLKKGFAAVCLSGKAE